MCFNTPYITLVGHMSLDQQTLLSVYRVGRRIRWHLSRHFYFDYSCMRIFNVYFWCLLRLLSATVAELEGKNSGRGFFFAKSSGRVIRLLCLLFLLDWRLIFLAAKVFSVNLFLSFIGCQYRILYKATNIYLRRRWVDYLWSFIFFVKALILCRFREVFALWCMFIGSLLVVKLFELSWQCSDF